MIKAADIPKNLRIPLSYFRDGFTNPSYESFQHLTLGVIACQKPRNVVNLHSSLAKDLRKSRTAYEYFFLQGKWSDIEVANRKAELFFNSVALKDGDTILLVIDDTHKEKKGEDTAGVGRFLDHGKGRFIWGNCFVTSCLQYKEHYIPHIAKMYLKARDAERLGEPFRTKPEIAYQDIIKSLEVPEGMKVIVVFDSWWASKELIAKILALGYNVICQVKSDRLITLEDGTTVGVSELAEDMPEKDFQEIKIKVRGKDKTYYAREKVVGLEGIGRVKLVISKKKDKTPNFYISTDLSLSVEEILETYEDRWNIETAHREGNQKLGFKDYQMRDKLGIERFIQLVFLAWTILLAAKLRGEEYHAVMKRLRLGELIDEIMVLIVLQVVLKVIEEMGYDMPEKDIVLSALSPYL